MYPAGVSWTNWTLMDLFFLLGERTRCEKTRHFPFKGHQVGTLYGVVHTLYCKRSISLPILVHSLFVCMVVIDLQTPATIKKYTYVFCFLRIRLCSNNQARGRTCSGEKGDKSKRNSELNSEGFAWNTFCAATKETPRPRSKVVHSCVVRLRDAATRWECNNSAWMNWWTDALLEILVKSIGGFRLVMSFSLWCILRATSRQSGTSEETPKKRLVRCY